MHFMFDADTNVLNSERRRFVFRLGCFCQGFYVFPQLVMFRCSIEFEFGADMCGCMCARVEG